jgi:uncharacterized damage-inducible protein DinB
MAAIGDSPVPFDIREAAHTRDFRAFPQSVEFVFTNGTPARMRRGEIILHVCLHGTYYRGNAGIVLHKNGIAPKDDRMTDFLETAA